MLSRTIFYREEKRKRAADASFLEAQAEEKFQLLIERKLKNVELAFQIRERLLNSGISVEDSIRAIGALAADQQIQISKPTQHVAA